ncbi:MAG: hypothetical protein IT285_06365 [Bdellovibrionales bacterium]|nr:hypothetical protein [Bdellovibrionales bacterium]
MTRLLRALPLALLALALPVPAHAEPMTLICKRLQTHPAYTPDPNYNDGKRVNVEYQKVQVSTPTGPQVIYAPLRVLVTKKFHAVNRPAGARGEFLADGQCGLPTSVIAGIDLRPSSGYPVLIFNNLNKIWLGGSMANTTARVSITPVLPTCASGVHQIVTFQYNPNEYNVASDSDMTCIP